MNAISRALAKRDRQRMEVRREAGAESGTDWATTLLFSCLHDKYGFGRNRFAAMNDMWEHLDELHQEGFIYDWRDELCEHGFDRFLNERIAERMQKMITGRTRDLKLMAKTRDMIAGVAIVIFWTLYTKYKWRDKRLKDLQNYYKDKVYVLTHNEVPIWEFMKCLHIECGIDYPALAAYEKQFGPVNIYRGNRGER
ncbi:hypothetical protein WMO23_09590 [Megasphaera sp. CLA-AA-H81]|uniref:Uncharacterized protein n=1 Tax=Megasphaera intestinihominis TaxID=3133159 RepID=A0ABV1CXW3_9FIRM